MSTATVAVDSDAEDHVEGSGACRIDVPSDHATPDFLAYKNLAADKVFTDAAWQTRSFRIKSSVALSENQLLLHFHTAAAGAGSRFYVYAPRIPANTWVDVNYSFANTTLSSAIRSVSLYLNFDNADDFSVWIDDLRSGVDSTSLLGAVRMESATSEGPRNLLRLSDGSLILSYRSTGNYQFLRRYSENLSAVLNETCLNPYNTHHAAGLCQLSDGNVACSFYDNSRAESGFKLLSPSLECILDYRKLSDHQLLFQRLVAAPNGLFYLYAADISEEYGAVYHGGNPRLVLAEPSDDEARLYNYSPESLELRLSVNK